MDQWSQNFALARFVGLKTHGDTGKWAAIGEDFFGYDDEDRLVRIPDFYSSLDDLRWVDETMTFEQRVAAVRALCVICDEQYGNEIVPSDVYEPAEMSAMFLSCEPHMRTEAILKSLGLWVEK